MFSFSFFAPVFPATHSYSTETGCAPSLGICSVGNNTLNLPGYGSFSYFLFGVGGWWMATSGYDLFSSYSSSQAVSTSPVVITTTTFCSITGQAGGAFLRVLSDSTQTPVVGAQVSATNKPAYCGSNQYTTNSPANSQTTITFTTNSTEWYSLDTLNNVGYSFTVRYSGQSYTLTIDLRPVSATCATLYVPSGKTNSTITGLQTACK